ncbi:MAG: GldG family protein [Deltaproteobacteria bacterium]|nr:MAG: GldG family protein [Deltaproteobacteria bacterium]
MEFIKKRAVKHGTNVFFLTLIVIGILVLVNFISARHYQRFDLTEAKLFTLSDQTVKVINGLRDEVQVTAFFQEDRPEREEFDDLIESYCSRSDKIKVKFVDPDRNPAIVREYDIKDYGTIVLRSGDRERRIIETSEEKLTNALIQIGREGARVICFLQGHGEKALDNEEMDGYSFVRDKLKGEGYTVKELILLKEGRVPEECSALVMAGAKKHLLPQEIELINGYCRQEGRALFLMDPRDSPELSELLRAWGIELGDDLIIDQLSRLFGGDFSMPVVTEYGDHPITEAFNKEGSVIPTFFPVARSVSIAGEVRKGLNTQELIKTSAGSWAFRGQPSQGIDIDPERDTKGPITVGVVVSGKVDDEGEGANDFPSTKDSLLVVFGDSDFATNQYFNFSGNGDLFLNSISWLAQEEELISIRSKERGASRFYITNRQGKIIFYLSVLVLPALIIVVGTTIWWRRRRR